MSEQQTTALAARDTAAAPAVQRVGDLIAAADKLGEWMAGSGMFNCRSAAAGKVLALMCLAEGGNIRQFRNTYHVTDKGDLVMRADAMLAKFKRAGGRYRVLRQDEVACEIEFTADGDTISQSFTIEQALAKGLVKEKSAWATWPEDMLFSTVVRKYLRRYHPEDFAGEYGEDEIEYAAGGMAAPAAQAPAMLTAPPAASGTRKEPEPAVAVVDAEVVDDGPDNDELQACLRAAGIEAAEIIPYMIDRNHLDADDVNGAPLSVVLKLIPARVRRAIMDDPGGFAGAFVEWQADKDAKATGLRAPDAPTPPDGSDAQEPADGALSGLVKAAGLKLADVVSFLRAKGVTTLPDHGKMQWAWLDGMDDSTKQKIASGVARFAETVNAWVKTQASA